MTVTSGSRDELDNRDIDSRVRAANDYFPVASDTLAKLLALVPIQNDNRAASLAQTKALLDVTARNILAMKNGVSIEIIADRLCAPYIITDEGDRWHRQVLARYVSDINSIPRDRLATLKMLVELNYDGTKGSGYRDLYTMISVKTSRIHLWTATSKPSTLYDEIMHLFSTGKTTFTRGIITSVPSIEYKKTLLDVLNIQKTVQLADVSIAAEDSGGNKYSRVRRLYWDPTVNMWLPSEQMTFFAQARKADPFF